MIPRQWSSDAMGSTLMGSSTPTLQIGFGWRSRWSTLIGLELRIHTMTRLGTSLDWKIWSDYLHYYCSSLWLCSEELILASLFGLIANCIRLVIGVVIVILSSFGPILHFEGSLWLPSSVVFTLLHAAHDWTAWSSSMVGSLGESAVTIKLKDCILQSSFQWGKYPTHQRKVHHKFNYNYSPNNLSSPIETLKPLTISHKLSIL